MLEMKMIGKPYVGELQVRFDEETGPRFTVGPKTDTGNSGVRQDLDTE
jgi:hypothetical protein